MLTSSGPSSERTAISSRAWKVLVAIFVIGTVNFMDRAMLSIAIPDMSREFGWSAALVGIALSSFLWTYALGNFAVGPFVDRFGPRMSQVVAMLFWAVSLIATAFTSSFNMLLGSRAVLGLAESPNQAIAIRSIRKFFSDENVGFACSIGIALVVRVGPIMGFVFGGLLIQYVGWRGAFLALAAVSLAAVPFWLTFYPRATAQEVSSEQAAIGHVGADVARFCTYPRFWAILGGMAANAYIQFLFFTWTPGYLSSLFKVNIMNIGFMSAAIFGFGVLGNLVSGIGGDWLLRRGANLERVRKGFILLGIVLCAPITITPYFTTMIGVIFILSLADFGINLAVPQFWATVAETAPRHVSGTFTGIVNGVSIVGGMAGPIVTGFLVQETGSFVWSFVVAGIMLVVIGLCFIVCLPRIAPLWSEQMEVGSTAVPA